MERLPGGKGEGRVPPYQSPWRPDRSRIRRRLPDLSSLTIIQGEIASDITPNILAAPHRMPVPPASTLARGVAVNIVLKADQRSGRLTSGRVADGLTRGNHPRGVKVRLQDGRVGRVQSLPVGQSSFSDNNLGTLSEQSPSALAVGEVPDISAGCQYGSGENVGPVPGGEGPPSARSLADCATIARCDKTQKSARRGTRQDSSKSPNHISGGSQQMLQSEFPQLDSALIAAILSDGLAIDDARGVLAALSPSEQSELR